MNNLYFFDLKIAKANDMNFAIDSITASSHIAVKSYLYLIVFGIGSIFHSLPSICQQIRMILPPHYWRRIACPNISG